MTAIWLDHSLERSWESKIYFSPYKATHVVSEVELKEYWTWSLKRLTESMLSWPVQLPRRPPPS